MVMPDLQWKDDDGDESIDQEDWHRQSFIDSEENLVNTN